MQVNGAGQGEVTIPRRRQLIVLLAILAAAATVVLLVWAALLATIEVGTQDATPKAAGAGSGVDYPLPHNKAGTTSIIPSLMAKRTTPTPRAGGLCCPPRRRGQREPLARLMPWWRCATGWGFPWPRPWERRTEKAFGKRLAVLLVCLAFMVLTACGGASEESSTLRGGLRLRR